MKKESKIINFFVGLISLIIIAFFYGLFNGSGVDGGVTLLFQFALISIICTGGITLIIWLPALYLLGKIVMSIIHLVFGKKLQTLPENAALQPQNNPVSLSSNNELAIIGYIVSCRKIATMSDEAIRSNLKNSGWNDVNIDNAFKKSGPRTS